MMLLNCDTGEDTWEFLDSKEVQAVLPKGNQSWIFIGRADAEAELNSLATRWEELTHLKRPWCWERLKAGGEGDDRGWDGWMASMTQWTWVWTNSGSGWRTGRPGGLQSMGSQRVGQDSATEQQHQRQKLNTWSPAYRLILWAEWDNTFTLKNHFFTYYLVPPSTGK